MAEIRSISGAILPGAQPGSQPALVQMLRDILAEAEAGRLVAFAGVIGAFDEGRIAFRFAQHTIDWEIHDRVMARVGLLRAFMERDYLEQMDVLERPLSGGDDDNGGDAA